MDEIIIPKGTKYLSEVLTDLPINCLFDKGVTGCGGTTIALRNSRPTVVCVPFRVLIENKLSQSVCDRNFYPYPLTGFQGGVTDESLKIYLQKVSVPKILVTYDSLKRLITLIDPKKYHLLVDEYHCLFNKYSFREEAAGSVLGNYSKFGSFTFMSATPIEREFMLEELKGLPIVKAVWQEKEQLKVHILECKNGVEKTIKYQIDRILNGELKGNYYFFVKSIGNWKKQLMN